MSEEFSVGVKILLERMDTNPEEFVLPSEGRETLRTPRWGNTMTSIIGRKLGEPIRGDGNFLTDAEVDALFEKYTVLRRKAFDDHILREVLGADEDTELSSSKPLLMGQIRFNDNKQINEVWDGSRWRPLGNIQASGFANANVGGSGSPITYAGTGVNSVDQYMARQQLLEAQRDAMYKEHIETHIKAVKAKP